MSKKKTPLDEFTKLLENPSHNLSVEVYTEDKGRHKQVKKPKEEKMTLTKLAKQMNNRFDQIDARLDYIVKANNLKDSK